MMTFTLCRPPRRLLDTDAVLIGHFRICGLDLNVSGEPTSTGMILHMTPAVPGCLAWSPDLDGRVEMRLDENGRGLVGEWLFQHTHYDLVARPLRGKDHDGCVRKDSRWMYFEITISPAKNFACVGRSEM